MAFVKFERPPKKEGTEISICETGEIKINRAASKMYNVFKFKHVIFHFDPDEEMVGIELTYDELDSGAVKIIKKKDGSCTMKAEAFLNHFDIKYDETRNFVPEFDKGAKMIIFDLNKER
ncbi:MAG: hypothetical protein WBY47_11955 [Desulfobacterales bacterium]|jgi:hypothetical protein